MISGGVVSNRLLDGVIELSFEIQLVLFADGEIAGPAPEGFAPELPCRKPAAEFVAKQIRGREGSRLSVSFAKPSRLCHGAWNC